MHFFVVTVANILTVILIMFVMLSIGALATFYSRRSEYAEMNTVQFLKDFWMSMYRILKWMTVNTYHFFLRKIIIQHCRFMIFLDQVRRRNEFYPDGIPKNEFDRSLEMDTRLMVNLSPDEYKRYLADLNRRRDAAHQRDMHEHAGMENT